jgi:hypothetical protein
MHPLKTLLRRLSLFVREAGQFSRAQDAEAVRRQSGSALARLDALERRIGELRAAGRETQTLVRRAVDSAVAGATGAEVRALRAAVGEVDRRVEQQAAAVRRDTREIRRHLDRIESQVQALLRHAYVPAAELPSSAALASRRFGMLSQNGEDGITWAILRQIGVTDRRFVDIGCADHGWNSGFLAEECGWSGVMVDSDAQALAATRRRFHARVATEAAFVTPETVDALFTAHGFTGEVDLLSIDVDGSDYWIWRGLTVCRPRVVILEYNSVFGGGRAVVVPYETGRVWDEAAKAERYFGASLAAVERLAREKGYRLVAIEPDSANAFLVRDDAAGALAAAPAGELFRPQRKYAKDDRRRDGDVCETFAALGLPLIDLDA